ncbi:MAG: hypothetical protein IPN72_20355 [Saprospiraceae bacterium]|nr:hypothetical protein [Saprospiraceae bacterium]
MQELRFVDYNPGTISGGNGLYCNGEVVTLTAIGGTIVSWSNGGNGTSTMVAAPNLITADIINNHGCITTPSKNIEAYNNEISISYSGESICDGTVIATPSIEYAQSYRWFIAGNLISTANSLNLVPYAGLSGGYVEATYGNNCVKSINLSLPPNEVCCYPPEFCGNFSPNKDSLIISFICSPGSIRDPNSIKVDC